MAITQQSVVQQFITYLNGKMSETELIHWAEDAVVQVTESDTDVPNEDAILDALMYIGAGDTPGFPLTWAVLADFLAQMGTRVRVLADPA